MPTDDPSNENSKIHLSLGRSMLEAQFTFYRRLTSKKHGFTTWFDVKPSDLSDAELEQAVAFFKDAAHLPPA